MCHSMRAETSHRVYWTDASEFGGGIVYAPDVAPENIEVLAETAVATLWVKASTKTQEQQSSRPLGFEKERSVWGGEVLSGVDFVATAKSRTVPPVFRHVLEDCVFTTAIACQWRRQAHIIELELDALRLSMEHASSVSPLHPSQIWLALDSAAALGILRKGRTSSFCLNVVARNICALVLSHDIWPSYFWTPTDLQAAKEPSRRFITLREHGR